MPQSVEAIPVDSNGNYVSVENGALAVAIQDQYTRKVGSWALMSVGTRLPIVSAMSIGDYTVELGAGHGFTGGEEVFISTTVRSQSATVLSVDTNTLTLDSPMAFGAAANVAGLINVVSNMNVNGAVERKTFVVTVPASGTNVLDIKGMRIHIADNVAMDDSKFGGISALTRGVVLRKYTPEFWPADEVSDFYFNIKSNLDFQVQLDNLKWSDKAPSGLYGLITDWRVSTDDGVTLRVNPGDRIEVIIQDDLTDLVSMKAWFYGHVVLERRNEIT